MLNNLKLSIITVNLNNAEGLRKTIDRVINQTYTYFEHIIIDGGSTDGSVEVIKEYEPIYKEKQRHLYWVSEPDKGIYNGMNKGIKVAKGEYCLFLNSGDWLIENDGLEEVFISCPVEDIVYCNTNSEMGISNYPKELDLYFFIRSTISHQSTFVSTKLFSKLGLYDETNKIISDWKFWIDSIIINEATYRSIPIVLTYFDYNGISSSNKELSRKEKEKILSNKFNLKSSYFNATNNIIRDYAILKSSRIIQLLFKIQSTKMYKKLRGVK